MPLESAPPFIIITAAITVMGFIQSGVHKLTYGKPKATGQDAWDRLNAARDTRVKEEKTVRLHARGPGSCVRLSAHSCALPSPAPSHVCPAPCRTFCRLGDAAVCSWWPRGPLGRSASLGSRGKTDQRVAHGGCAGVLAHVARFWRA